MITTGKRCLFQNHATTIYAGQPSDAGRRCTVVARDVNRDRWLIVFDGQPWPCQAREEELVELEEPDD